ncbi:MAG: exonuclease domain-containing protein [Lachnospiraceae bacterium]|nr:exonuclease domain-containing protein [Lachnospiraceae bacterium]
MEIIVLDLEWNQSNRDQKKNRDPEIPIFEIIEIGAVKLNENREITDCFSQLICPQIYHTMHRITADIINLEMDELKNGRNFPEVMEEFLKWCGKDYVFATWGPLDLLELQRNMNYYRMESLGKGPLKFYDVQKLFSLEVIKDKTRKTLEFAIDYFQIEKKVPFHRAFSDAYYTAKVLEKMEWERVSALVSYDTFHLPRNKKEEIKVIFPGYAKYISRGFEEKKEVMEDREVASTKCYLCRKNVKKKMRWYTPNGKNYYSVAYCEEHGYIKYKVRVKKSEEEKYYAVKTSKFTTIEKVEKLRELRARDKEIKKNKKKMLSKEE